MGRRVRLTRAARLAPRHRAAACVKHPWQRFGSALEMQRELNNMLLILKQASGTDDDQSLGT